MLFESEEEYIAFKTWEYKLAQQQLKLRHAKKKKTFSSHVSDRQKREIAYLRGLFLDKDADTKLSRAEMSTILGQARHKKNLEKKDLIPLLVRKAQAIVFSR